MNSGEMSLPLSSRLALRWQRSDPQAESALRELTLAIRRGDEQAFTRFYELYSLRLYKYLLVLAKGNEAEAREVLQTVVLKLARKVGVFDDEGRLWAWLCRVARNAFVDHCRSNRKERGLVSLEEMSCELGAAEAAEHRLAESLRQALEEIAPEESELLRSAYVDERPLQELADETGQTYKAVESRLARLREKLRTTLLRHLRREENS